MKKILVVDCGSSKVPGIEKMVSALGYVYDTVKLMDLVPFSGYAGIIISGAPILLTEVEHTPYLRQANLLFGNSRLPVLGICFGHQLMGLHHGATVSRCAEDRDFQQIHFTTSHPFIPGTPGMVMFHEDHCECISLPAGFILQASSVTCVNEAMQHRVHPWWGVQFHPETSGEAGNEFIGNFIRYCTGIHA